MQPITTFSKLLELTEELIADPTHNRIDEIEKQLAPLARKYGTSGFQNLYYVSVHNFKSALTNAFAENGHKLTLRFRPYDRRNPNDNDTENDYGTYLQIFVDDNYKAYWCFANNRKLEYTNNKLSALSILPLMASYYKADTSFGEFAFNYPFVRAALQDALKLQLCTSKKREIGLTRQKINKAQTLLEQLEDPSYLIRLRLNLRRELEALANNLVDLEAEQDNLTPPIGTNV